MVLSSISSVFIRLLNKKGAALFLRRPEAVAVVAVELLVEESVEPSVVEGTVEDMSIGLVDSTLDVSVPALPPELCVLDVGCSLELPGVVLPIEDCVPSDIVLPGVVLATEGPELLLGVAIVEPLGGVDVTPPASPPPLLPAVEHIPASHVPLLGQQLVPSGIVVLNNVPINVVFVWTTIFKLF